MPEAKTITGHETRPEVRGGGPGPETKRIVDLDTRFLATTTKTAPIAAREAKGCVVLGVDGDVYLDFCSGVGVVNTGHSHPDVVGAVTTQAQRLAHFAGTDFYYESQATLANRLSDLAPGPQARKVFFSNSGTEAVEAALKLVRWATRRLQVIAFKRAFHGRTLGSLSMTTSKAVQRARFFPTTPGVHTVPFPDPYRNVWGIDGYDEPQELITRTLEWIEELFATELPPDEAGALFAEPVQGEGGYNFPPTDFYRQLKGLLDEHGILLAADEIQTGYGRTGKMFAMEHYGVSAPIMTLAKGMGSGFPIGACVFDAELDFGTQGAHSNTFGGNLVSCAAALATLDVFEEEQLVVKAARLEAPLAKRLGELKDRHPGIGDARGKGLMFAVDFVADAAKKTHDKATRDAVLKACYDAGLILLPAGRSAIRIIPPLVVTREQLEGGLDVFTQAVDQTLTT